MSIRSHSKTAGGSELVVFSHAGPVPLPELQPALAALWRHASEGVQAEAPEALALACLWNLVAFHSNPKRTRGDSGGEAQHIEGLLERVTASLPARVIHLEEWRDEEAPSPGREVEAWVSTHCLHRGGGGHLVTCEAINLAGYGEKGHAHFPALVRALLMPDLPVALLWLDDVPRKGRVLGQLLQLCERMIIDVQHTSDPQTLPAVHDLLRSTGARVVDLGWLRLGALRHLVADFFDPPGRAEQLGRLERIAIATSPQGRNTGLLLLGWLLSRCGLHEARAVHPGPADDAWRWQVPQGGGVFPLDFSVREGYGGLDGIFSIDIQAGGDTFSLHDVDPEHMAVKGPERDQPRVALREPDDAGLVVAALGRDPAGRVFAEALAVAAALVETEQWNR